ncbi:MAG: asparagine synthase (glutamine-hydrolyzing) [Vicinamibacteria bacterium]|nr:asparagine synthase (glutamine-hydrolyzing) [Vicinamibacteria bacterium]
MCGIAGALFFDGRTPDPGGVAAASAALARRGPDGAGEHVEAGLALVHRRLAILDLSDAGAQPMEVDGGRLRLVYNGELYNFRELRRGLASRFAFRTQSDAEVLLRLYDAHPDDPAAMLRDARGMFAFALWDAPRRRLLLGRDRLGIKPLFVHESPRGIWFASTLDALVAFPDVPRRLDWTSLRDQLALLTPPSPQTFWADARALEPGTVLSCEASGTRRETHYWSLQEAARAENGGAIEPALVESARLHLVADVGVGAFLSGGLDSGLVTACAAEASDEGRALRALTASFPGDPADESDAAAATASRLGLECQRLDLGGGLLDEFEDVVAAMDQPLGLLSAVPLFRLARAAAGAGLKCVLTGDGGDELFAGYLRHRPLGTLRFESLPRALHPAARGALELALRAWPGPRAARGRAQLLAMGGDPAREYLSRFWMQPPADATALLRRDARPAVEDGRHAARVRALWDGCGAAPELTRMRVVDLGTSLVDEMLAKADRMTMAWGVEARVPLLDHRLVEAALALSPSALRRGDVGKLPLREIAARRLGAAAAARPKRGFETSFARDLAQPQTRARLDAALESALAPGLLDADAVRALRRHAEAGDAASVHGLFAALCAGEWARQRGVRA